jgi:peptidoglycan hydrolase-like amidase
VCVVRTASTGDDVGSLDSVRLSQCGAKNMASKGFAAKDILAFYYSGATLVMRSP